MTGVILNTQLQANTNANMNRMARGESSNGGNFPLACFYPDGHFYEGKERIKLNV